MLTAARTRCDWRPIMLSVIGAIVVAGCGSPDPISRSEALQHTYGIREPQFRRVMGSIFGQPLVEGNTVTAYEDGPEIFAAMLDGIRSAQRSITLEMYIFRSSNIGEQFVDALVERARAGVKVHLIIDAVGSEQLDASDERRLKDAGTHIVRYNPIEKILFIFTADEVNQRTHRKILVIDGKTAFIGGIGIDDIWLDVKDASQPWRETMYRVQGPVVAQLQAAFMENWREEAGDVLDGEEHFPQLDPKGEATAQIVTGSVDTGNADLELMYLLTINAAEQTIDMGTAYFVPNELLVKTMQAAAKRGVKIRIVVPGPRIDSEIVRQASHDRWDELLKAGIEIYEYQPSMYHCKVLVGDGIWTCVGSANLDPRSLRLNDEANLNVFDEEFAAGQIQMLERDMQQSKRVTEIKHKKRSLFDRFGEFLSALFGPQL